ncbi:hypothetical protein DSM3645_24530 [Blastopirellula marina DSM 3645]|uniref:Uncharacterized protein n=1 Tax=Blastopirellula marina DSM 3645 TaxID=314230 RepID=A3ZUZ7_9BACT|nr:hypothetical protein DSM3645_24530 [Blastopirellula marina DSM 3645]
MATSGKIESAALKAEKSAAKSTISTAHKKTQVVI